MRVKTRGVSSAPEKRVEREREQPDAHKKRAPWLDVRARKRSLPGARFLEECRGKQGAARGDLFGSIGFSLLKPPGDGFHKHCGHEVWYKLI